jgi:hypothetical protein
VVKKTQREKKLCALCASVVKKKVNRKVRKVAKFAKLREKKLCALCASVVKKKLW